ncbi:secreted RxLR effector protein 161-like [Pistacia vera]|uniref:secreted RxLR effector protein 161-like n=1 Tax=Pistacia vera TaxID=55513 RepID=UPI0012634E48|nr:secreted RxLR effector protein 161-like [Pistacia vera]
MAIGTKLNLEDSEPFENSALYRSTVGALQYLTISKPNISYVVNKLSQFLKAPTQLHWQACKRLLRYLKGTSYYGLQFSPSHILNLTCYTDMDWANSIPDRRSTSGCCVFMGNNLIQWYSRKQKVVALSSTEAEYRALAQGMVNQLIDNRQLQLVLFWLENDAAWLNSDFSNWNCGTGSVLDYWNCEFLLQVLLTGVTCAVRLYHLRKFSLREDVRI